MEEEFKVGDIVYLLIGGPKMIILESYTSENIVKFGCIWFESDRYGYRFMKKYLPSEFLTRKDPMGMMVNIGMLGNSKLLS
jgi:uncharacterized protein YodC (DUF2158 family)